MSIRKLIYGKSGAIFKFFRISNIWLNRRQLHSHSDLCFHSAAVSHITCGPCSTPQYTPKSMRVKKANDFRVLILK